MAVLVLGGCRGDTAETEVVKVEEAAKPSEADIRLAELAAAREAQEAKNKKAVTILGELAGELDASWKGKGTWPAAALAQMKKDHDEFKGTTWYKDRNVPANGRQVHLYFGQFADDRVGPLRIVFQYEGDNWVFLKEVIVKADDRLFTWRFPDGGVTRHNAHGTVWEFADRAISIALADDEDIEHLQMLQAMLTAKTVKVRFGGDRVSDFIVPAKQIAAMKNVVGAFAAVHPALLTGAPAPIVADEP